MIYCRVSTKEQVEEGNSLVTQERNCREYAIKNGYDIAEVFIEQGESAKTADRTELQKLFQYCATKKNNIQAVIAYKIDRISRNTDDYSQIRILLKRYGVEIKSTSEYFENTPAGRFMENIIANVAQFDNDVRTERSVGGMKEAIREGRYVWMAPFGYMNSKINGKSNIIKTEKAELIKIAFENVASTLYSVEEVRRKMGRSGLCSKGGNPLSKTTFYRILKNEVYAGWITQFGERHKGVYDSVISEELFNKVQRTLQRKKQSRTYLLENSDFTLRRFIIHPNGEKLTGSWSQGKHKKYAYYRFPTAKLQWPKDFLEKHFLSFLNQFSFNKNQYMQMLRVLQTRLVLKSEKKKKSIDLLLKQQNILKEKQQILVQKSLSNVLSDNIVKDQMNILEEQLWKVHQSLEVYENRATNFEMILQSLTDFFITPGEFWKRMPFPIKLKLLKFEFPEGIIFDGTTFRTPEITNVFKLKELFSDKMYRNVNYPKSYYRHLESANHPIVGVDSKEALLEEIKKDLIELDKIIKSESQEIKSSVLFPK